MSILREIVINTKAKLEEKKKLVSLDDLKKEINELNLENARFKQSLTEKDEAIIAEIKKASPSAGIIAEDFDPIKKAKEYEELGAVALSILTEEDYFLGSPKYLKEVRKITQLPILRKDFMIDEYQIYEAKLMGADCILLIASILNDEEISHFIDLAE
ncbi:MAG: indole-3-glycerol phosphate synthase TrpC, partial [Gammaproteobacteria bacterium]